MQAEELENEATQASRRKKYSWVVVAAAVVNAIVGSGIVRNSAGWASTGGFYALLGILLVWVVFMIIGISMVDNLSMMPEKGGVYTWTRRTMGRFYGTQIGWIYLVGFTSLSVYLAWLAYQYTLSAITFFFPAEAALLGGMIFSIFIPMLFIVVFTVIIRLGVKNTTQVIVAFFTIKVTMWLTIVGIGLLHFDPSVAQNSPSIEPIWAVLSVGVLSLFAMNGIDAVSVISDDIHEPKRNYKKGVVIGMIIVLFLYLSTVIVIMGLVGQDGVGTDGITDIFLGRLNVPTPVLLVFIVISIVGTLFINMYLVIRLSGAMSENNDFFFGKHARKKLERRETEDQHKIEIPTKGIILSTLIYAIFFALIFVENIIDPDTTFVLYVIDKLALWPFLIVLFFIAFTNFKAHRMGLSKKDGKNKKRIAGIIIPLIGMLLMAFIIGLSIYNEWSAPSDMLPGPGESYAWLFWRIFGLVFPAFMIIPGLLYWGLKGRNKTLPVENIESKTEIPLPNKEV